MIQEKQERYDELDNIINSLDVLIDDITDKYYIDILNEIKFEAQNELEELQEELNGLYEEEEKEANYQYERSRL